MQCKIQQMRAQPFSQFVTSCLIVALKICSCTQILTDFDAKINPIILTTIIHIQIEYEAFHSFSKIIYLFERDSMRVFDSIMVILFK